MPAHLGRANYAETLAALQALDRSEEPPLEDGERSKRLTCYCLLNGARSNDNVQIRAGEPYYVRVTGLTPTASQALETVFLQQRPATWRLAGHTFEVVQACCDAREDGWSGRTMYEALAAGQLLQPGGLPRKVTLQFYSATSFQSKGMHVPVPLPNLVFGSLVDRWNAFSPVTLSPEIRRFGEELVALSNYDLKSGVVQQKSGAPLIGGIGRATYSALGGDQYWLATMQMLADFALYSGVGVKTTIGMGQVRRVG